MANKNNLPGLIIGAVVLGGIAFVMTEPPKAETSETSQRTRTSRATTEKSDGFTEEDLRASFARIEEPVANAFKPLIARSSAAAASTNLLPNQVPPYMVNGESSWFYTGTAYIDEIPSVLLENTATGSGQYLKVGESMMGARITKITPNTVVLSGSNGTKTLTLIENRPIIDDFTFTASTNAPLDPMVGPIGITANDQDASDTTNSRETEANLQDSDYNDTINNAETQTNEAP